MKNLKQYLLLSTILAGGISLDMLADRGFAQTGQPVPSSPINLGCVPSTGVNCTVWTPQQWINAWESKADYPFPPGAPPGIFNVRLAYGAKPDGTTDNSISIAAAFTASNAFTVGTPTVYFDCDTTTTTCQYNYGGAGVSPINPLIPTTIACAPGVVLNYTGSSHAVDVGPTGQTQAHTLRYTIQGCIFTGGASYTAGIFFNDYVTNSLIFDDVFRNFGNQVAYSVVYTANDWTPIISHSYWSDSDGVTRNMVDAHTGQNVGLLFTDNKNECETSSGTACSVSMTGVGLWIFTGWVIGNEIKYHYPAIRISSCQTCGGGQGLWINHNLLEGNTNGTQPAISYGDPGTVGAHIGTAPVIDDNFIFWPTISNVPNIGPETAASGSFSLDSATIENNHLALAPSGGASYVEANAEQLYVANNRDGSLNVLNQASSPPLLDTGFTTDEALFATSSFIGVAGNLSGALAAFDQNGINLQQGNFHTVGQVLTCADVSGNSTAQACNTNPRFTPGAALTPVAGDAFLYTSTTTNTGSLAIDIDGVTQTVMKNQGQSVLGAGDFQSGAYNLLIDDGAHWEVPAPHAALEATTGIIVPGSLTAGACVTGNVSVAGATIGMGVVVTPTNYPGNGTYWDGFVPGNGTVSVNVCGVASVSAGNSTYNVRVIP